MHRRSFLSLSALSALPVVANAADDAPENGWFDTISSDALTFKAKSDDDQLVLQVELSRPPEDEVTEAKDDQGGFRCYQHKGKDLPRRFWPGQTLLTRFDLTWGGKAMKIQERFWNDLAGFRIQTSTLDPDKLKPELQGKAYDFLLSLEQPRLSLSADGGTVLIEWTRPEEGDAPSTLRWIVSQSGTVLRHRHTPPHEC